MHAPILQFLLLAPLAQQALALPSSCGGQGNKNGKAIYMITNTKANSVVALSIGKDGLLEANGSSTATGGAGGNGIDGSSNKPASPDPLFRSVEPGCSW